MLKENTYWGLHSLSCFVSPSFFNVTCQLVRNLDEKHNTLQRVYIEVSFTGCYQDSSCFSQIWKVAWVCENVLQMNVWMGKKRKRKKLWNEVVNIPIFYYFSALWASNHELESCFAREYCTIFVAIWVFILVYELTLCCVGVKRYKGLSRLKVFDDCVNLSNMSFQMTLWQDCAIRFIIL